MADPHRLQLPDVLSAESKLTLESIEGVGPEGYGFVQLSMSRLLEDNSLDEINLTPTPTTTASAIEVEVRDLRNFTADFRLGKLLGQGGQGEVREAEQLHLSRPIALKIAHGNFGSQFSFLREAFTTAQLDHPNIVPLHDLGRIEKRDGVSLAIAMKRIQGASWRRLLIADRRGEKLTREEFLEKHLRIFLQVINGVSYAHSKGVIHRDLKPSQVMVGSFGEVLLLDWGLGVFLEEGRQALEEIGFDIDQVYTLETAVNPAGTPAYMAPEQAIESTERLGAHTDIYLLGAILYELLSGVPPHMAATLKDAMEQAKENRFTPLPENAPEELSGLAALCLDSDPLGRPRTARDVADFVEAYLSGAGRRSNSRRRTRDMLQSELPVGAEDVAAMARRFQRAAHDWPDNPELEECRKLLHVAKARAGLDEADLLLAQSEIELLGDCPEATELRAELDAARQEATAALSPRRLVRPATVGGWLAICLLVAAIVGVFVHASRDSVTTEISARVEALARMGAEAVQPEDLLAVDRSTDIQSREFQRSLRSLSAIRATNPDVRYVYTMRPLGAGSIWRVLVDIDPTSVDVNRSGMIEPDEAGNPPGATYDDGVPAMREALETGQATSSLLRDDWGEFLSGFAPIAHPETGEPYAIACVDMTLDTVEAKLSRVTWIGAGLGAIALLLVSLSYWALLSSRNALEQANRLEKYLHQQMAGSRIRSLLPG